MLRNTITVSARRIALAQTGSRAFHNSPISKKTATEKVTEAADKVGHHTRIFAVSSPDTHSWV